MTDWPEKRITSNGVFGADGELETHLRTLARAAFCPNVATMGLHNTPRDVKTQAQPTPVVLANLPEPLEYGLQHCSGDALTCVVHAKFN